MGDELKSTLDIVMEKLNGMNIPELNDDQKAKIAEKELYRTFNMGIGMAVVVDKKHCAGAVAQLKKSGIRAWGIGEVIKWAKKEVIL